MNTEYRTNIVDAVKKLARDKFGRISHADHDRLWKQIKADFKAGIISDLDRFNVSCVLGRAVNLPYEATYEDEVRAEQRALCPH